MDVEEANEGSLGYSMLDSRNFFADTNMFFFSGNTTTFTNDTIPDSRLKNGASTHISVTDVSAYGDTMTATISLPATQSIIVSTDSAADLTTTAVTLQGTVNTNGVTTTVWFEYGTASGSYGSSTSTQTVSSTSSMTVSATISGLLSYTMYHYRLVAQTTEGTRWDGGGKEFATLMDSAVTVTPRIAAGHYYTLALNSGSTVYAWGYNHDSGLGDGTAADRKTAVQMHGLSGITALAGGRHSLALRADGTVWGCGYNYYGQLGDGTTTNRSTPAQVKGLSDIIAIAAGEAHSLALKSDGTVWAWGYNYDGQLGNDTWSDSYTPVQVTSLNGVTAIAAGGYHTIALKSDGTVWTWGYNKYGQLGDGTTYDRFFPVQVSGINLYVAATTPTPTPTTTSTPISLPTPTPSISPLPTPIPSPSLSKECIVSGYVANQNNNLLEDVTITITGIDFSDRTSSDEEGYYLFSRLVAGEYTLTYEKEGYVTKTREISLIEGEEKYLAVTVLIEQMQNGRISGYVYNMKGNPIESAKIRLKGVNSKVLKKTTSDEDGLFEFTDLDADTYIITALKKGYKTVKQTITLEEGEEKDIEIVIKKMGKKIK